MRGHRFHTSFGAVFGGQYVDDGLRVFADHLGIFNFGFFAMPIHSMLTRPGNWMACVTWQLFFFSDIFASFGIMYGCDGQPFDQNRVARMFERLSEAII